LTEAEIAQLGHGKPIDLSRLFPCRIDEQGAAGDLLIDPVAQAVGASDIGIDGALHMFTAHQFPFFLAREIVRLPHEVRHTQEMIGKLFRILRQA
jgi:hypothetical protein